jgi:hypothetical protein
MNIHSTVWMLLIAVGAFVVAIANIQYNRTREAENKRTKALQVKALLRPELERNQELLTKMRTALDGGQVPVQPFDTTAWKTISGSDLLLGLPDQKVAHLMQVYRLLNRANDLQTHVLESTVGVMSALGNSDKTRQLFLQELVSVTKQLEQSLKRLIDEFK